MNLSGLRISKGPAAQNKALLFENVKGSTMPVLINAFGNEQRMAWAMGAIASDAAHPSLTTTPTRDLS